MTIQRPSLSPDTGPSGTAVDNGCGFDLVYVSDICPTRPQSQLHSTSKIYCAIILLHLATTSHNLISRISSVIELSPGRYAQTWRILRKCQGNSPRSRSIL